MLIKIDRNLVYISKIEGPVGTTLPIQTEWYFS